MAALFQQLEAKDVEVAKIKQELAQKLKEHILAIESEIQELARCTKENGQQIAQLQEELESTREQRDSLVDKADKLAITIHKLRTQIDRQLVARVNYDQSISQKAIKQETQSMVIVTKLTNKDKGKALMEVPSKRTKKAGPGYIFSGI